MSMTKPVMNNEANHNHFGYNLVADYISEALH